MLNKEKHQLIMTQVLNDIYNDITINSLLGFKGGTCAYFFYNLPRFSVDLDFDLLEVNEESKNIVFEKIVHILTKYGEVKQSRIKRFTIFALLSYGENDHNIKIEINTRKLIPDMKDLYHIKKYLGVSTLVAKPDYLFAGKLSALTLRQEVAMRDIFDIYYYASNHWDINREIIKELTNQTLSGYLSVCIDFIENIKNTQILQGVAELVENEKQKAWIKNHLKSEVVFMLKNYHSSLK